MAEKGGSKRPLSDYTIPVNDLLDSGIPEVAAFGRTYMRKIFGISTPAKESPLSISHLLSSVTPPPQQPLKRERQDSLISDTSDDEERHRHATYLLNLASPEAVSRTPSRETTTPPARKKCKSRYADAISQPFSQMVRPAYEFMSSEAAPLHGIRYIQHGYGVPESPPQSPPDISTRVRARPGRCARRAQGCNENTKFRPVISDWTCYKNYEPCPKDSQVGWCNKCWCNKGHYSDDDFFRRKFDLLEDQIIVWAEEFRVPKFEVWLQNLDVPHMHGTGTSNTKIVVDPTKARQWVTTWRRDWERTGKAPTIKIRPV